MVKRGLGKGLEALLPGANSLENGIQELPVERIAVSPHQPRQEFDEEKLTELASSIREHGVVQPIVVRRLEAGKYQLIAGERRLRACIALGLERIPAVVRESSDIQARELALVENIQRENLDPLDEAEGYRQILSRSSITQEELARKLGKSRSHIANSMRLLTLPIEIKKLLRRGVLTVGHAKVLMSVNDDKKLEKLGRTVAEKKLSVRDTEELVWREVPGAPSAYHKSQIYPETDPEDDDEPKMVSRKEITTEREIVITRREFKEIEDRWQKSLGTRVKIRWSPRGKGKIEIEVLDPDDLGRLGELLGI